MTLPSLSPCEFRNLKKLTQRAPLILASASPRRRMFLEQGGVSFQIVRADIAESSHLGESPEKSCLRLASQKALTVINQPDTPTQALVLGADTIVFHRGQHLGKPRDSAQARRLLSQLSGETHTVYTGVSLLARLTSPGDSSSSVLLEEGAVASTQVTFKTLSQAEIESYVATGDPLDKAGGYGAQETGAFLVDHLDGHLDTVIGLPRELVEELAECLLDRLDSSGG